MEPLPPDEPRGARANPTQYGRALLVYPLHTNNADRRSHRGQRGSARALHPLPPSGPRLAPAARDLRLSPSRTRPLVRLAPDAAQLVEPRPTELLSHLLGQVVLQPD